MSQDPMFWSFDSAWLSDPQNQNSYSYARNNPIVYSDTNGKRAELIIKPLSPIPGAHSFVQITTEQGADYSQYGGDGSRYTIGGYMSSRNPFSNQLVAQINESGDYNFPKSERLMTYSIDVPEGLTTEQHDRLILGVGYVYSQSKLGNYTAAGQPLVVGGNCHNTSTGVVMTAGGNMPAVQSSYNYSPTYGIMNNTSLSASDARTYLAPGLGTPLGGIKYNQQATMSYASTVISVVNQNLSSRSNITNKALNTYSSLLSSASLMLLNK